MSAPRLICRFLLPDDLDARWGEVVEGVLREVIVREGEAVHGDELELGSVRLLPPTEGGRVFGIGRNYAEHVEELNPGWSAPEPLVFMKPDSALLGAGQALRLPAGIERVDYEGELALVIGRGGRRIPEERALDHILGVTCANDISARDLQQSDGQWIRAKGFDGFCPLGPWVARGLDPRDLALRTRLNGAMVQDARSSAMIHGPARLVAFLSSFCTLRPGDVVLTGTPAGVGPLKPGDHVCVEVEGVGLLETPVVAEGDST
jgi:2-keto-4-pentenoate hydratase/2-oxohepta-3-ene-1,7-dioic acid hydratase in catechol pathway